MFRLELEITKECNLACDYCFQTHQKDAMDEELGKRAIDFGIQRVIERGDQEWKVLFFGGEVLLYFSTLQSLTEYARSQGERAGLKTHFDLTTNGTLFTEEVATFLAIHNFRVKISLDGRPEDHNRHRRNKDGLGSYDLIMRNVAAINLFQQKTQKPIQISMVVNRDTYHGCSANLEHIVNKGFGYIDLTLNRYEDWQKEELEEIEQELEKAAFFYIQRAKEGKPFNWTLFDNGIRTYIQPQEDYFCGAGVSHNYVTTDGSIYPCSASTKTDVLIGTIDEGYFAKQRQPFENYCRNLSIQCTQCELNQYCSTCDCLVVNVELTGTFNQVPDVLCQFTQMQHRIAKQIATEFERLQIIDYRKFFEKTG